MTLTFRQRQVALSMCVGMILDQTAKVLELSRHNVNRVRNRLFEKTGMFGAVEFALHQNAAVREQLYGEKA